jgi:NAD(P)H-dependent flavin oxidoreductase YrpB (nitropropane dioxygenase family)
VDLLFPAKTVGDDETAMADLLPAEHKLFVQQLMDRHGIRPPKDAAMHSHNGDNLITTNERAREKLEIIRRHEPKIVASALGPAPKDVVDEVHDRGGLVVGLVGAPGQATRHVAAGADIIVAQGTEAGGHTGEISTLVLVPQVVDEVAPVPVLAAGGIGNGRQIAAALALGAQGVWTGSIWLLTTESNLEEPVKAKLITATSTDTVRTRCLTGKPIRQLRTPWVAEWEAPDAPRPLPAPLQGMLVRDTLTGIFDHNVEPVMGTAVGQVVGMMRGVRSVNQVLYELVEGFLDGANRLASFIDESS